MLELNVKTYALTGIARQRALRVDRVIVNPESVKYLKLAPGPMGLYRITLHFQGKKDCLILYDEALESKDTDRQEALRILHGVRDRWLEARS